MPISVCLTRRFLFLVSLVSSFQAYSKDFFITIFACFNSFYNGSLPYSPYFLMRNYRPQNWFFKELQTEAAVSQRVWVFLFLTAVVDRVASFNSFGKHTVLFMRDDARMKIQHISTWYDGDGIKSLIHSFSFSTQKIKLLTSVSTTMARRNWTSSHG